MPETNAVKRITPPYATAAGLKLFFTKIKSLRPTQVTKKWAEDNELPFAEAIVNTMKFLKAVDKDGNLTPEFNRLRLEGEQFESTLASLVLDAYKPIFDQVADVGSVSDRDLSNAFKTAYDVGAPARYVTPFLTLTELAGLRVPAAGTARASTGRVASARTTTKSKTGLPRSGSQSGKSEKSGVVVGPVQVVLRLDIPWDATVEEIQARIRAIQSLGEEN
jgi:hypothetical protein